MSRTLVTQPYAIAARAWARHHHMLMGIGLALILAAVVLAIAEPTGSAIRGAPADDTAAAEPWVSAVELPREWRWERDAITFDHMFRRKESPGRSGWVMERGHSFRSSPQE